MIFIAANTLPVRVDTDLKGKVRTIKQLECDHGGGELLM